MEIDKGYSKEEEYFYRQNQALIEKKRQELDARREPEAKHPHWMKCPKCPGEMKERELVGIKVDQCEKCNGIYFDHGELEILLESKEPSGFFGALKRVFNQ